MNMLSGMGRCERVSQCHVITIQHEHKCLRFFEYFAFPHRHFCTAFQAQAQG